MSTEQASDDKSLEVARLAAERVARESYGRLVAYLSTRCRDLFAVEDALSEAFAQALEIWPQKGVPQSPEAWLLTAARRRLIDYFRKQQLFESELAQWVSRQSLSEPGEPLPMKDERWKLMLVCTHPSIDAAARAPLILQTSFGFDAATIASTFLVSPATMSQRLVRAKTRIRDLQIPVELPPEGEWPERVMFVLDAMYAAWTAGCSDRLGSEAIDWGPAHEVLQLIEVVCEAVPDEPEVWGLKALVLYTASRRQACRDEQGRYVPLDRQLVSEWDLTTIQEAEECLLRAASFQRTGRYQLEAAIQSAHTSRVAGIPTNWRGLLNLYDQLLRIAPSYGAFVSRAACLLQVGLLHEALVALEEFPADRMQTYQPYWATKAAVLARLNQPAAASDAYDLAIGLATDPAVKEYLYGQAMLMKSEPESLE